MNKGVYSRRLGGRIYFGVRFNYQGKEHRFGSYKDDREAAKAHDLYCIKKGIDRPLNVMKKI